MSNISRGSIQVQGFSDKEMDFQLIRQLGSATENGASVGECLEIVKEMKGKGASAEEWVHAFERHGDWQKEDAMARLANDHIISAREQFLKACNSYRAAEYYSSCDDPHHQQLGIKSESCFAMAMSTMDVHFESHSIPYKNINLPVYFISPANDGRPRKTLMIVSGFDGTLEEEFIMRGIAGIRRDYNIILFAGPGQMDVFRYYPHTAFEPDYEQVLKKVIDHFEFRQEVRMQNLALMGVSFGGYFATRAAAFEPRIKALIANSPILNLFDYLAAFTGMNPLDIPDEEDFHLSDIASFSEEEFPEALRAQTEQMMIRFGRKSFKKTFEYLKAFAVTGDELSAMNCKCLALLGEAEGGEPRKQFEVFCEVTQASSYEFDDFHGAGMHCQVGNISFANAVVYDWLDEL